MAGQPLFEGLVKAFDLAAGLRMVGAGVAEADAAGKQGEFQGDTAVAAERPVKTAPLSLSREAGLP